MQAVPIHVESLKGDFFASDERGYRPFQAYSADDNSLPCLFQTPSLNLPSLSLTTPLIIHANNWFRRLLILLLRLPVRITTLFTSTDTPLSRSPLTLPLLHRIMLHIMIVLLPGRILIRLAPFPFQVNRRSGETSGARNGGCEAANWGTVESSC